MTEAGTAPRCKLWFPSFLLFHSADAAGGLGIQIPKEEAFGEPQEVKCPAPGQPALAQGPSHVAQT